MEIGTMVDYLTPDILKHYFKTTLFGLCGSSFGDSFDPPLPAYHEVVGAEG